MSDIRVLVVEDEPIAAAAHAATSAGWTVSSSPDPRRTGSQPCA